MTGSRPADITIEVPGQVRPKSRARARIQRAGGRTSIRQYSDPKTASYENAIKLFGATAMRRAGFSEPIDTACTVRVTATFVPPPSWPAKKRASAIAGDLPHITRPDLDNCAKAALDGCNQIAWTDDSRVAELTVIKRYGAQEQLVIEIWRRVE
jgi:Holliday junction resolvase RusA-like endonuclease